jgi:uncharacterized membrane protein
LKDGHAVFVLAAVAAILSITQADGPYTSLDSVVGVVLLLLLWAPPSIGLRDAGMRVQVAAAAVVGLCATLVVAWPMSAAGLSGDDVLAGCWLILSLVCWVAIRTTTEKDGS